ncbi:MAG: rod shape-determining protein RodA [Rhodospirillaceae bacterium]|jgi:rod shape determining protein RodA|nr:rod shape-determining protein RodA [Rhodospirillaceae bacterium]MBT5414855.1 rod shape-determining protein RodA [Rhodospirillaceae bacterium]
MFEPIDSQRSELSLLNKFWQLNWVVVLLLCASAGIGFAMLYSAGNGSFEPWASRQIVRFGIGIVFLLVIALIDLRFWYRYAYPIYLAALALLAAVEFAGFGAMGAQRWINLGIIQLQPAEIMKIALVLALARYFHAANAIDLGRILYLILPLLLVAGPTVLMVRQPDLGTAVMLVAASGVVFFLAGVRLWMFGLALAAVLAAVPVAWHFLHGYQKKRIMTFLDPSSDPLGAGYHILQSKIALGSGAIFGKGFLQGTQSHLNFLPEKQTDFIFTMLAEEFGLAGGLGLLGLYFLLLAYGMAISLRARSQFGRLLGAGVTVTFFLYLFINIGMVMGLLPVVGVPLPMISYGGTAMLAVMIGFGLLLSVGIHRDLRIGRRGPIE